MAPQRKILVIGATGHVGREVVKQLAEAGADVRALVRAAGWAKFPRGVEVARGDLSDPTTLQEPCRDVDAVFLMWPFLGAGTATRVLEVIRQSASRVVYLSAAGVDLEREEQISPIHRMHAAVERAVLATGLDWVVLRPYSFANNNLAWADQLREGLVRAPGAAEARTLIHETDIAAVAVRALLGNDLVGKRLELSGPAALTTVEQVNIIGEALGKEVRYEEISREAARSDALAAGHPEELVEALFDSSTVFVPQLVTNTVEQVTGKAPRSVHQWALDHAEAFQ
ncbi:SDR family oxidoreductase [Antrihabitans sp. YC2-6]|uniref:SDR family oxidoreductase n=1 Tax=Antrihabitans sp. YC2-6 TaxID=2799498 RepID=UPI0018F768AC|nr:NAD(P)H-binding protein [Antrihabitans sp. YC2-6]MBJ8348393.1 NAD(P)H-binding protein [Antrihabitans sp. YC2-6]